MKRCILLLGLLILAGHAHAGMYVVDQAAPGADDTNVGTEEKPFKTVQRAADAAQPGDTIYVMAGKYNERVLVGANNHSPASVVDARGRTIAFIARPRRSAIIRGFELKTDCIRVEGFEITADKPTTAVQLHASHCEIVDNYIHDMATAVSGTAGTPSPDGNTRDYSAVAHNRIAYNKVYHCEYGFILGGEDWLVENNEVSRLFMYDSGNRYDDCDYTRFFGKGCIQRYNYYHGSTKEEIKTAHVDCLQTFTNNGEIAMDLLFEYNTCFDFHQMCMVESTPHIGSVRGWTFRRNIVSPNAPTLRGGWGPDIIQTLDVTIENCTISTVAWAAIGLRGKESTVGLIRNNILCEAERAVDDRMDFTPSNPVIEYNLTYKTAPLEGDTNINNQDPLFVDPQNRNFRLRQGSPAIAAGRDNVTLGALDYPNVYYVDPRHPAACDDPAWGYPAVPLATLTKACEIAHAGETVILRGGVYREPLAPRRDGVTFRAMPGEEVTISGADLIEGWRRESDGSWSAPLTAEPGQVLRDSRPWTDFSYDKATRRITARTGGNPRLHTFEVLLRRRAIDTAGRKDTRIEGIKTADTLTTTVESTSEIQIVGREDLPGGLVRERLRLPGVDPDEAVPAIAIHPALGGPFPVAICLHWFRGAKENVEPWCRDLAARGVFALAIDAHLHGERSIVGVFHGDNIASLGEEYAIWVHQTSIARTARDVPVILDALARRSDIDISRVAATGFSMGASTAMVLAWREPRIRVVAGLAGAVDFWWDVTKIAPGPEQEQRNASYSPRLRELVTSIDPKTHLAGIPPKALFLTNGGRDPYIDIESIRRFVAELEPLYGKDRDRLRFVPVPEAGHEATAAMWKEAQDWIVRGLESGGGSGPARQN